MDFNFLKFRFGLEGNSLISQKKKKKKKKKKKEKKKKNLNQ